MITTKLKLILAVSMMLMAGVLYAQDYTVDGLCYSIIETDGVKSAQVEQHPGTLTGNINVPPTVNIGGADYTVTSIAHSAFYGDEITSITLPNTIVQIGAEAFGDCRNLTSISLPSSLKTIELGAFSGSALYAITIPRSVTSIDGNIVVGCEFLDNITVESGNSVYDSRNNCNAVIQKDENTLIFGCKNTIIPNDVEIIGPYAFVNCKELTYIEFPEGLSWIGYNAFSGCTGLTTVNFPENLSDVGDEAFSGCTGLTYLYIPRRLSIGKYTFRGCGGLQSITVSPENRDYDSRNDCNAIIRTNNNTLILGRQNTVIPSDVTTIDRYAFEDCTGLTSIVIPDNVTTIRQNAFSGCNNLNFVSLPSGITSLSTSLFMGCTNLTEITIPNGVKTISGTVFSGCSSLQSVVIPASVTKIQTGVFASCENLVSIIVESGNTNYDSRDNCNAVIETSTNTLVAGCKTTVIPEAVTAIANSAFDGCKGLTSMTIPENVTIIGHSAFEDCENLTNIIIPNKVTEIGQSVFRNSGVTSLIIPESVTKVYQGSFEDCKFLPSVSWPSSLTEIPRECFVRCSSLRDISIPEDVTSIAGYAFTSCAALASVELPSSLTSLGAYAFWRCDNLEKVTANMTTPPAINENTFPTRANATLYVPVGSLDVYNSAQYWNEFGLILEQVAYIPGDANGDGSITVADYIAIAHYIMGTPPANFNEQAADANGDGQINVADYIAVAHIIMNDSGK